MWFYLRGHDSDAVHLETLVVPHIFVQDDQRFFLCFHGALPKHQDIGVVVRQDASWTLFVKKPVAGLDGVDLGDEGSQIDVGRLPVLGSCLYHVEALAKTELKTNRYQGARSE